MTTNEKKPATPRTRAKATPAPEKPARKAPTRARTPKAPDGSKPPVAPDGLTARGRALWRSVVEDFTLRPDELTVLEQACRARGRVDELAKEFAAMEIMIAGSTGQLVVNPLLMELRNHEAHVAALLARLKLKDVEAPAGGATGSRSSSARERANARWAVPHAHGQGA